MNGVPKNVWVVSFVRGHMTIGKAENAIFILGLGESAEIDHELIASTFSANDLTG